jgi:Tfp pilus assembly protein PilN
MYGDTTVIRALAADLRTRAEEIRAAADRLAALAERVPWDGLAADAMRGHARDRTAALRRTARLHDDAADALDRHAREVDRLKDLIAAIEQRSRRLLAAARDRLVPDLLDDLLRRFVPPPPGSREWLTVDLPGGQG